MTLRRRRRGQRNAEKREETAAPAVEPDASAEAEAADAREAKAHVAAREETAQRKRQGMQVVAGKDGPKKSPPDKGSVLRPDLPLQGLTAKQERFAVLFVCEGLAKSECYRRAYNVGPDTSLPSIYHSATKISQNPKVVQRIAQLQEEFKGTTRYSPEQMRSHAQDELFAILFDKTASPTARLKAIEMAGKMPGIDLFKEEGRDPTAGMNQDDLKKEITSTLNSLLKQMQDKEESKE